MVGRTHQTVLKKRISRSIEKEVKLKAIKCEAFIIKSIMSKLKFNFCSLLGMNSTWGRPLKCSKRCLKCNAAQAKPSFDSISIISPEKQMSTLLQFRTKYAIYLVALGSGDVAAKAAAHRALPETEHAEFSIVEAIKELLDDDLLFGSRRPEVRLERAVALLCCPRCVDKAKKTKDDLFPFLLEMHKSLCDEDEILTKTAARYLEWLNRSTSAIFGNRVISHRTGISTYYDRVANAAQFSTKSTWSIVQKKSCANIDLGVSDEDDEDYDVQGDRNTEKSDDEDDLETDSLEVDDEEEEDEEAEDEEEGEEDEEEEDGNGSSDDDSHEEVDD